MDLKKQSKFLSLVLRHRPEAANITLDKNGWAHVNDIMCASNLSFEELEQVVYDNDKQRFEFNDNQTKIRARQGHSVKVDVELEKKAPPRALYHGTKDNIVPAIMKDGLLKMSRLHVHLSKDEHTAKIVGDRRRGQTVILQVDALRMYRDGHDFYLSNNGVWLTDNVPPEYILSYNWPIKGNVNYE